MDFVVGILSEILGRVVEDDFPRLLFSVIVETFSFVGKDSQAIAGFKLCCFGRLSGWTFNYRINCDAIATIFPVDFTCEAI